jgi:hypothetical protein
LQVPLQQSRRSRQSWPWFAQQLPDGVQASVPQVAQFMPSLPQEPAPVVPLMQLPLAQQPWLHHRPVPHVVPQMCVVVLHAW